MTLENETHRSKSRGLMLLAAVVLASFGAGAITSIPSATAEQLVATFETVTAEQLAVMLERKDFLFVNVHIPYEGEIAQTDAFIPFDQIGDHLDQLPGDETAAIVLYCRSGRMSEIAAAELAALGYTGVSHLAGGMLAWSETGHEILNR